MNDAIILLFYLLGCLNNGHPGPDGPPGQPCGGRRCHPWEICCQTLAGNTCVEKGS